jgi:hypothetical protein
MRDVIVYGMSFAVPGLKGLHMGVYCQCKGKGVSFDALKADRESRFTATLLTSAVYRSGEYHAPAGLPRGTTPVTIEWEAGWAPLPVRTIWSRDKALVPGRDSTPGPSNQQPDLYTD